MVGSAYIPVTPYTCYYTMAIVQCRESGDQHLLAVKEVFIGVML